MGVTPDKLWETCPTPMLRNPLKSFISSLLGVGDASHILHPPAWKSAHRGGIMRTPRRAVPDNRNPAAMGEVMRPFRVHRTLVLASAFLSMNIGTHGSARAADDPPRTIGSVERLDPALDTLVPQDAKLEVVGEGFAW